MPAVTPPRGHKSRRCVLRLATLLVVFAGAVWFAPAIAARTGLVNRIARDALGELRGTVEIGGMSLGWLRPVELHNVTVKDTQGRTLLTAPKVTSSKTLLAFLRDRADLGEFTVERPAADVVCEKGTTNLEDTLANYLNADKPSGATRPAVTVHVTGGTFAVRDAEAGTACELEAVDATVGVPAARSEAVTVKVSAASVGSPGKLDAYLSVGSGGSARLAAENFPMEALAPLLKRVKPGVSLAGRLTTDLKARWATDPAGHPAARVEGTAAVQNLDFGGPWLRGDRLRLASVTLPLAVETAGRGVRVERADLTCDAGTLSAAGMFDPDDSLDHLLNTAGLRLDASVDLAKLAALLPKLLRVRAGTAIREGKLTLTLASHPTPAGTVPPGTAWAGTVTTSALKAERDGKPFEWAEPLAVQFKGHIPPGHLPTFDQLVCQSDFIAVNAQGSPESFRASANVYLDRLAARLGEFVDLGGVRLAGSASVGVIASRTPQGAFKVDAGGELKEFAFAAAGHPGLSEQALTVKLSAAGQWPPKGAIRVQSGSASLVAGPDTLDLKLVAEIPDARRPDSGIVAATLTGDLGRWAGRVRGFVDVPRDYRFGGTATVAGTFHLEPGDVTVDALRVSIDAARFHGAGLDIDERLLTATAAARLTRATGTVVFSNVRLAAQALSVVGGKFVLETPPGQTLAISGEGPATSNLTALGRTLRLSTDPAGSDAFRGTATGPARFRWQGDTTTFGGTLDVTNFAYGDPAKTGITEAAFKLDLDGKYDQTPDRATLTKARIERPGLTVDGKGAWANFATTQDVALAGTLTYDLAKLTPELRNTLGGGFQAAGQGSRPFSIAGRLAPGGTVAGKVGAPASPFATLTGDAALGWESLKAYGFDVGAGEFSVKLADGRAAISPVRATFGGGQVTLTPSARFAPGPAEVTFARGKVVDHAKLTPAVCAGALGYALPAIANAAQAAGEISATLDDNRVPLADVTKATMKGQLLIHKATVGPGPVITEIAKVLGASSTTMTLANETTVPVRVEGGRVYHENFAVTVNGYVVKTTGSVGFDGSLALVADVPIPGTFPGLANNPALKKALEGKVVKVPIAGTMAQPAIDPRQFQAAVANLTRDAAKGVGKELLNKELEKLIPGGTQPGGTKNPVGDLFKKELEKVLPFPRK